MYRAVNVDGAPCFEWWDAVAQVPFSNTAIADPGVSQRVYAHLAPWLLERRGIAARVEVVDVVDCALEAAGDLQGPGSSTTALQTSLGDPLIETEPEEDIPDGSPTLRPPQTLQMLIGETHPEEPFRRFIPTQISELKSCLERFGGDRLASYDSMRITVPGACFGMVLFP